MDGERNNSATEAFNAILEGYWAAIEGRLTEYSGDLRAMLADVDDAEERAPRIARGDRIEPD